MAINVLQPIIVGVGDVKNTSTNAVEPMELILNAIEAAAEDAKLSPYGRTNLLSKVDSIDVVRTWTWPYDDLASLLAQKINARPSHVSVTRHGGDQPAKLVDEAARRISTGESNIAIVTGGESLASSIGGKHAIGAPIQVYPLYENGFRAARGQSIHENNIESAQLYADFANIAAANKHAWNYGKASETEDTIGTITKRNRMICFPYPLLMNAFNNVNLAAGCILTSTEYAHQVGIPESQWVYPRGGAGTSESEDFSRRLNFYTSPSISHSLDAALKASSFTASEIDVFDFYSCFPIVPKLACTHLGLPLTPPFTKPISLLGGLTSFGGAGNNYSMHAITHMVRYLREGKGKSGLVLANGGVATYQHAICLSISPGPGGKTYPGQNPLPDHLPSLPTKEIEELAEGEAVVETYTVDFGRDGNPTLGHVVGRLVASGKRFIANHGNEGTLKDLSSGIKEPIGRSGRVETRRGENLFTFDREGKL